MNLAISKASLQPGERIVHFFIFTCQGPEGHQSRRVRNRSRRTLGDFPSKTNFPASDKRPSGRPLPPSTDPPLSVGGVFGESEAFGRLNS